MKKYSFIEKNYFLSTILLCGTLALVKLLSIKLFHVNLWVDEAQYWTWSKELAAGYYSKPPFIAWLIHLTTIIFGDNEFGIRFSGPLVHFATALFVYLIAAKLYDNKTGFFSAIMYFTLPAVTISSAFISTDAPLMLFWAASLYFIICAIHQCDSERSVSAVEESNGSHRSSRAAQDGRKSSGFYVWFAYAFCVGLGLLSKYTMAAFVFMSFAYIFMNRKGKEIYKPDFWLANTFAFLIFVPNLIWNYNNHFVSFLHTSENVVTGKEDGGIKFTEFLEFAASQLIVFGPALIFFIIALVKNKENRNFKNPLVLFSIPLLIIGIIISLSSGAQAHWAAPAYIGATIITVNYILQNNKKSWLRIILIINIVIYAFSLNVNWFSNIPGIKKDPLRRVNMWFEAVPEIEAALEKYPDAKIVSDERKIIAPLMFALRDNQGNPKIIYKWNPNGKMKDHYDMTKTFNDKLSMVLFISRGDIGKYLQKDYQYIEILNQPDKKSHFYLYLLDGRKTL